MLVPDRHRRLLEHVREAGSAQVDQLADTLGVSRSTVRRDLGLLASEGLLLRARGGAYVQRGGERIPATAEVGADVEAKQRIGRVAAERVEDGMTVMILAGSTTATMLPQLADRSITLVTNGLEVAHTAAAYPDVELVLLGGILHREQMTLLGPMTEQNMANLHVDVLFAGAYGVAAEVGVTGNKVIQAGYHHSMLQHADALVVLADGTKFGRRGPTVLARVDQVDLFLTDTGAPEPVVQALRERGTTVTLC